MRTLTIAALLFALLIIHRKCVVEVKQDTLESLLTLYGEDLHEVASNWVKYDPQNIDISKLDTLNEMSFDLAVYYDVRFPTILMLIWFKETSLCRNPKSLCHEYNQCHNYIGMKCAKSRKKDQQCDCDGVHASYVSAAQCIRDFKLRNDNWMPVYVRKKGREPKTEWEFIEFLRMTNYNPYDHYYDRKGGGLYDLYWLWEHGDFQKKYNFPNYKL